MWITWSTSDAEATDTFAFVQAHPSDSWFFCLLQRPCFLWKLEHDCIRKCIHTCVGLLGAFVTGLLSSFRGLLKCIHLSQLYPAFLSRSTGQCVFCYCILSSHPPVMSNRDILSLCKLPCSSWHSVDYITNAMCVPSRNRWISRPALSHYWIPGCNSPSRFGRGGEGVCGLAGRIEPK